jgi:hypothetical protein
LRGGVRAEFPNHSRSVPGAPAQAQMKKSAIRGQRVKELHFCHPYTISCVVSSKGAMLGEATFHLITILLFLDGGIDFHILWPHFTSAFSYDIVNG